ncbi:hypothetical protein PHMEG_0002965 [Phytophthora megakarya]|uniref:Reverse transcriptase n=1 Tax=Phytophthora megakarya TaxID=4795 RepID=A0A225WZL7_9STRA|nr:hypothetical protein PHMEG_0002965 [Phytophthora megakarya]
MIEQSSYDLAKEEPKECDKEWKDQLYPLAEVELQRRMKQNAKARKPPSLEEMSRTLGIPVEKLGKTKEASKDVRSTPEFWTEWCSQTLATTDESKRANRDFKGVLNKTEEKTNASVIRRLLYDDLKCELKDCFSLEQEEWVHSKKGEDRFCALRLEETHSVSKIRVDCLLEWTRKYYNREAPAMMAKMSKRSQTKVVKEEPVVIRKNVAFLVGSIDDTDRTEETHCAYEFVPEPRTWKRRPPGLCAVNETVNHVPVVPDRKRVICSVGDFEVLWGYIDCYPTERLAYSGAIASLVHERVLRHIERVSHTLRTYSGSLYNVSGHSIKVRGVIELPITLGTVETMLSFVVVDRLHVDAILGTDILKAFGAVIDWKINVGVDRERSSGVIRAGLNVTLSRDTTVLVEGITGGDDSLRIARTLCTVQDGQVIVEICNASTEELVIKENAQAAVAAVVPVSAFQLERELTSGDTSNVSKALAESSGDALKVDFSDSDMNDEQYELFAKMLNGFKDLFVETSKRPGRTDLLNFKIDTGTHAPINQQPYRVSRVEGEVMEAEMDQYTDLGLIRPSMSPWASPVLMIRKPDVGGRFCIDYRKMNAVTIKDSYPMPLIDDILDVLGQA